MTVRCACGLVLLLLGGSASGEMASAEVEILVQGIQDNLEAFSSGYFDWKVDETRWVKEGVAEGDAGEVREVHLKPKLIQFVRDGERYYFRSKGGAYSVDLKEEATTNDEGAFNGGYPIILDHDDTIYSVFPMDRMRQAKTAEPRAFFGHPQADQLARSIVDDSSLVRVLGTEPMHGDPCIVLESTMGDSGPTRKYWIDQNHGFLVRRAEVYAPREEGNTEIQAPVSRFDMESVQEVVPGVWAPVVASVHATYNSDDAWDWLQRVEFSRVDITTAIDNMRFELARPQGYNVHDYVNDLHFDPDIVATDIEESLDLLAGTANESTEFDLASREGDERVAVPTESPKSTPNIDDRDPPTAFGSRPSHYAIIGIAMSALVLAFIIYRAQKN